MSINFQSKIENSASILIIPDELHHLRSPYFLLKKTYGSHNSFDIKPLNDENIELYFHSHSEQYSLDSLTAWSDEEISFKLNMLQKEISKQKGASLEKYMERAGVRYLQETLEALRDKSINKKIYHKLKKQNSNNYIISQCYLKKSSVSLSFKVNKDTLKGLFITAEVKVDDKMINLASCQRYKFLLLHEHDYYFLSLKDRLLLDWLEGLNMRQYAWNDILFIRHVVQKIAETHPIDRGQIIPKYIIETQPTNCVMLSELSDSLLMLTPRWNYEGILVDLPFKAVHEIIREGKVYEIKRNLEVENDFIKRLQKLHHNFEQQSSFFYLKFTEAKRKNWFLNTYNHFLEEGVELIGLELLRYFRYSPHQISTELTIVEDTQNKLKVKLNVSFGKEHVKLSDIQKTLRMGQSFVLLKDNSIGVLTDEWLEEYANFIKHGKINQNEITISKMFILGLKFGEVREKLQPVIPTDWQRKWIKWQDYSSQIYSLPNTLKAKLRPYQHKGFEWITLLSEIGAGACLADDMGLGKTIQTIAFLCYRHNKMPDGKTIICCPASLIYNWENELKKFAPHFDVFVYNGVNRNIDQFINEDKSILICTYGTLRNDIDVLSNIKWQNCIIDESQYVKNLNAQTTQALFLLKTSMSIALTGTPILNNTFDLYAQMEFLVPGLLGGQEFFRKEYAIPIDRDVQEDKIKQLHQMTSPFILKRTKEQVVKDLPQKTESILWCNMSEEQQSFYNQVRENIQNSVFLDIKEKGLQHSKLNVLQGILKLRQACGAIQLLSEYKDQEVASVKIDLVIQELKKLGESKALVFSQFREMLHLIGAECRKNNIKYYHFDGSTPIIQRQEMVDKFQSDNNDTKVFLISLKSGNAGLNLTAADYVFLMDPWWNSAVEQQAISRTHRIGQTKSVFAYKMLCKDTIEEKILRLQEKKQFLSNELVSVEDGFVKKLNEEDIAYLFS